MCGEHSIRKNMESHSGHREKWKRLSGDAPPTCIVPSWSVFLPERPSNTCDLCISCAKERSNDLVCPETDNQTHTWEVQIAITPRLKPRSFASDTPLHSNLATCMISNIPFSIYRHLLQCVMSLYRMQLHCMSITSFLDQLQLGAAVP